MEDPVPTGTPGGDRGEADPVPTGTPGGDRGEADPVLPGTPGGDRGEADPVPTGTPEEIAAKQTRYYQEHREEYNTYMRNYMRARAAQRKSAGAES